jgi:3-dehydroquinate dehydratase
MQSRDAAELVKAPLIEVHLSNPLSREEFRHTSVISGVANGTIGGFGPSSICTCAHRSEGVSRLTRYGKLANY